MSGPNQDRKAAIIAHLQAQGFDTVRVASPALPDHVGKSLHEFVAREWHGDMHWLANHLDRRQSPLHLWEDCKSVIMVGMNYGPVDNPLADLQNTDHGIISVY
ncbi:MAG: QueG-associated DUF1730 domain-containing protein, partial [Pseudomonadota bacterium]